MLKTTLLYKAKNYQRSRTSVHCVSVLSGSFVER